jgi:hypothetical protein
MGSASAPGRPGAIVSARKGREPGPAGFTWRGIKFAPLPDAANLYGSASIEVADDRSANWRCERLAGAAGGWHARLKIGGDRFPGVGKTHTEALEAAAGEASNVATYIVAMLPPGGGLREVADRAASKREPRRAIKVRR